MHMPNFVAFPCGKGGYPQGGLYTPLYRPSGRKYVYGQRVNKYMVCYLGIWFYNVISKFNKLKKKTPLSHFSFIFGLILWTKYTYSNWTANHGAKCGVCTDQLQVIYD